MNSSIVRISGSSKDADLESVASMVDLNLIHLRHKNPFTDMPVSMRGFQGGRIQSTRRDGVMNYKWFPYLNTRGEDIFTPKPLYFEKNSKTNENLAVIPDTKYNRNVLAKMYYTGVAPKILEKGIDEEVREVAEKFKQKEKEEKTKDVVLGAVSKENEELRAQLEEQKKANNAILLKQATLNSIGKTDVVKTNNALMAVIRRIAETEVYAEKITLVDNLKEKHGDNWIDSKGYKECILPLIEERLSRKLKDEGI